MREHVVRHRIAVRTAGEGLEGARDHACGQIAAFVARLPGRPLSTRVKLTAVGRPSIQLLVDTDTGHE